MIPENYQETYFMTSIPLKRRVFLAGTAALGIQPARGLAQSDLPRAITLIVPFAAGGATDVVSRLVSKRVSEKLGIPIVVENVAGAGGAVGAQRATRAVKDGSVLLMGTIATHVISPLATPPAPFDPVRDFTPISLIATVPNVLLVSPNLKVKNVQELIAMVKADPSKYSYGSSGVGTPPHLSGELFKAMTGVDMTHIPYRGGAPAMTDLIGGAIPVLFDVLTGAASHIRAGTVRALAITTSTRSASFPELPTMVESGLSGYETYTFNAVFGPAGVPRNVVSILSREFQQSATDPQILEKLKELSANPVGSSPETLANLVKSELAKWQPIIKSIGGLKLS
jgi:tripartite-type tricarboxylate transporter receptor subunit TctC